jgi:hypothetical protein
MRVALLLTTAWLLALLGWLAGANTVENENPPPSTADMWRTPLVNITSDIWGTPHINITSGFPLRGEHPLCSDPLMRLTLRIGIRCGPPPRIVFRDG